MDANDAFICLSVIVFIAGSSLIAWAIREARRPLPPPAKSVPQELDQNLAIYYQTYGRPPDSVESPSVNEKE